jgi:hypothetical protein
MSNMLRNTTITYFQLPNSFLTKEIYKKINKTQMHLYQFLWKESQKNSKLALKYSGKELAEKTWMVDCQVIAAREGLEALGLIMFEKVQGGYEYSLCNPDTGQCLSNPRQQEKGFDFTKMTSEENETYFIHGLEKATVTSIEKTQNGLRAGCPLCKGHRSATFEVNTAVGMFHCHKCENKGKLVDFEVLLALAQGDEITRKEAHLRVCEGLRACGVNDVTMGLPEAVYAYPDKDGEVVFEICRFPGKQFRVRTINKAGDPVYKANGSLPKMLYRLPDVLEAKTVFVCEGEKDADTLHMLEIRDNDGYKIAATTNSLGANKWRNEHTMFLKDKRVILIGDTDSRGIRHMDDVMEALTDWADVARVDLPLEYKDVSNFLETNHVHDLRALLPEGWIEELAQI